MSFWFWLLVPPWLALWGMVFVEFYMKRRTLYDVITHQCTEPKENE